MKIFLVRHGLSEGNINKSKYFEKLDCDIAITETGKAQALEAGDRIMDLVDHISNKHNQNYQLRRTDPSRFNMFYSSYKRAKQTANIIHGRITSFEGYDINEFKETPLLREREWGSLRDIVEMGEKQESHFNFFYRPTGGESFADCFNRVALFHQFLLNTTKYENNIVVAHGEFNQLYMMYLLGWGVDEFKKWKHPKNGEVFLIEDGKLSSLTPLTEKYIKH